jgi:hypothetical protein
MTNQVTTAINTGIRPAYRKLIMDMSVALGLALDYQNFKEGTLHAVNIRGQVNSAFAPAQVNDFMDWMMAINGRWVITTVVNGVSEVEELTVARYATAFNDMHFVTKLSTLLHGGSMTMLMGSQLADIEDPTGNTRSLTLQILDRNRNPAIGMFCIGGLPDTSVGNVFHNSLVEFDETSNPVIDPVHVALVSRCNQRSMGYFRHLKAVRMHCSPLIGKNKTVESVVPLSAAVTAIDTVVASNLIEYGFKLLPQLVLKGAINKAIDDAVLSTLHSTPEMLEKIFTIEMVFSFMADDRSSGSTVHRVQVSITPGYTEESPAITDPGQPV